VTTRVLLTGGAGFLGAHTLRYFLEHTDYEFVCPVTFRHKGVPERIEWAVGGLVDPPTARLSWDRVDVVRHDLATPVSRMMSARWGHIDMVLNLASDTHPPRSVAHPVEFVHNNVALTLWLLEWCRAQDHRPPLFVQVSTDSVYGPAVGEHEHREGDERNPNNPYCLAPDTEVLMRRGMVPISEFDATRDRVLSRAGSTSSNPDGLVRQRWAFDYTGPLLTVRTAEGGEQIRCTPDHRFFVRANARAGGGSKIVECRARDLRVGDRVAVIRRLPISPDTLEPAPEFARLLGYWIADGSYSSTGNRYIRLADQDHSMIEFYRQQATVACGPSLTVRARDGLLGTIYKHGSKDCWYLQFASRRLLGLVDLSDRMNVIDQAMNFGSNGLGQFIAGWIDGDGSISRDGSTVVRVAITSHDARLRRALKFLLRRLGVVGRDDEREQRVVVTDSRSLQALRAAAPSRKWRDTDIFRKAQRKPGRADRWMWARVTALDTEPYDGKIYDLEVLPHHNYLANYFLVHNSASKAMQEDLATAYRRSYRVPVLIAATMNPTGVTQDTEKFVPMTIGKLLRGDEIVIHTDVDGAPARRRYLDAADFAEALLFLTSPRERDVTYGLGDMAGPPLRYNIAGPTERDVGWIVAVLADELGVTDTCKVSQQVVTRAEHGHRYAMSGAKLALAGWQPKIGLEDTLRYMARWYRANPEWLDI